MSGPPPTRRGYDAKEVVSALQKAVRRSQPREALAWSTELDQSGYTAWAWKRVKVIASEDIGIADPTIAAEIRALYENWWDDRSKNPRGGLYLAHAVLRLATAKKSRLACWGSMVEAGDHADPLEVPDEALDRHTARGRQMGRGMEHFIEEAAQLVQPDPADVERLEAHYYARFRAQIDGDPDLPLNPWPPSVNVDTREPAQNSDRANFGQLRMSGDTGEER